MVMIHSDDTAICCDGHAGDTPRCAMLTALTVSTITNIERIGDAPDYALSPGRFVLSRHGLSHDGMLLADSLVYALQGLARDYPDHFSFV